MKDKPIFIVGVQRSGTTLLRLILNAHSEIAIPEEARFLTPILKKGSFSKIYSGNELRNVIKYLKNNSQFALWNFDANAFYAELDRRDSISVRDLISLMFSAYSQNEGKSTWGDKSLFFGSINTLYDLFPDARFIHIVRDGRDVFASWRKMDPSKKNPAVMAIDWVFKENSISAAFNNLPSANQLTIRYEDLLEQPQKMVAIVCEFLEIEYEDEMLDFYKSSQRYIGEHHSELIFNKIDSRNTKKWKTVLNRRDKAIFTHLSRSLLKQHNYETESIQPKFFDYIAITMMISIGLPYRAFQVIMNRVRYIQALKHGADVKGLKVGEMPRQK